VAVHERERCDGDREPVTPSVGIVLELRAVHDSRTLQRQPEPILPIGTDAFKEPGETLAAGRSG
jgi:hypothetical protein